MVCKWVCACLFLSFFIYVLTLVIQLSREEGWDHINCFKAAKCLWLSQTRTWISNVICRGLSCVEWVQLIREVLFKLVLLILMELMPILLFKSSLHNSLVYIKMFAYNVNCPSWSSYFSFARNASRLVAIRLNIC